MEEKLFFKNICSRLGVALSDRQIDEFFSYRRLILEWNEKINLTSITENRDMLIKHFADSLTLSLCEGFKRNGSLIDVGTGAGFPGIPVKIAFPKLSVTLLDSLNKRINFLDNVSQALSLENVALLHARAEDAAHESVLRESFDTAVSRAVAPLNILCEYTLPFVKIGGCFIALKGGGVEDELDEAKAAIKALGGELSEVKKMVLPESDMARSLVVIEKTAPTPSKYPRKAGKALKNPIK